MVLLISFLDLYQVEDNFMEDIFLFYGNNETKM